MPSPCGYTVPSGLRQPETLRKSFPASGPASAHLFKDDDEELLVSLCTACQPQRSFPDGILLAIACSSACRSVICYRGKIRSLIAHAGRCVLASMPLVSGLTAGQLR
ncbi:hypothetical protein AcW2_004126 [Taiwanofungus camphoratus]|nr:hypothetical protein AcW2_004126 [Antrodia cinnamomea]